MGLKYEYSAGEIDDVAPTPTNGGDSGMQTPLAGDAASDDMGRRGPNASGYLITGSICSASTEAARLGRICAIVSLD